MDSLFVYGTLRQGYSNEHILKRMHGTYQDASVRGTLVNAGWGAAMGCPGIKLSNSAPPIEGQVFTSSELTSHLAFLDDFEGHEYQRIITEVSLLNGEKMSAYVYVLVDD